MASEKPPHTRKIHVCHVLSGDLWAGAEVQVVTLLRQLARREDLQIYAVVLNPGRVADELRNCGVEVEVAPENQGFWRTLNRGRRFLHNKGVRIVHSHRYKENLLAALLASWCRIPIVVRTQHGQPEPYPRWKRPKQGLIQWVDRRIARYATDRIISVSNELRTHLVRSVDASRVVTIHNGVDPDEVFSGLSVREAKRRLAIPEHCPVIGTVGRVVPVKRLDLFLDAAERVSQALPEARFVVVGEGPERTRLQHRADQSKVRERVSFLGHRDDIYDVLRAFDLFLMCSDHEGLPMALLETLHLGVPVVARGIGGVREVMEHGVNGLLVDSDQAPALAEACLRVLQEDGLRSRLADAGRRAVNERFHVAMTAARVAELYGSLCEAAQR